MKLSMEGMVMQLQGDLTHSEVTQGCIDSLSESLQQLESLGGKYLRIDCGKVRDADVSGLQMLYVWMQCARLRGVESELVNLPYILWKGMQGIGFGSCFQVTSPFQNAGLTLLPAG